MCVDLLLAGMMMTQPGSTSILQVFPKFAENNDRIMFERACEVSHCASFLPFSCLFVCALHEMLDVYNASGRGCRWFVANSSSG